MAEQFEVSGVTLFNHAHAIAFIVFSPLIMGKSQSKASNPVVEPSKSTTSLKQARSAEVDDLVKNALQMSESEDDGLSTPLQITVAIKDMRPAHYFVVLSQRDDRAAWSSLGVTEMSGTTSSVQFNREFRTNFNFEAVKRLRLEVYKCPVMAEIEEISPGQEPRFPPIAEVVDKVEPRIADALISEEGFVQIPLAKGGQITMFVAEQKTLDTSVGFNVRLVDIDTNTLPGKAKKTRKLKIVMFRATADGRNAHDESSKIMETEVIEKAIDSRGHISSVDWNQIRVTVNKLCRGSHDRDIYIELWDASTKAGELIGSCSTTYRDLDKASKTKSSVPLTLLGMPTAKLMINAVTVEKKETFLDYIAGGLSINLFVAIDFTKSNKDPNQPDSLHNFSDPRNPNDYVKVISSVGEILQSYDQDRKIAVYGFGARLPPTYSTTSHCFACNGNIFDPEVVGVEEIIRVYREALDSVVLHGPTNFNEIIRTVADFTEIYADPTIGNHKYSVLLIMTDGVITDMKQTINEIVRAAELPMSIVIVGIGDEDFGLMKILDGDEQRLYSTDQRKFAARDIVQFVRFNDFKDRPLSELASETLQEIPREVVNYFKSKQVVPRSRTTTEASSEVDAPAGKVQRSDIAKQLEVMKRDFLEAVTKVTTDVDEFEVYRIITEEHVPTNDLTHFKEIVTKAPRGRNVLTIPRPSNVDSPDSATKARRNVVVPLKSPTMKQSPPALVTAPSIDISASEGQPETVSAGKPIGSPISALSPAERAQIAGSFTVNDLKSPTGSSPKPAFAAATSPRSSKLLIEGVSNTISSSGLPKPQ